MQKTFLTFAAVIALSLVRIALAADDDPFQEPALNTGEPKNEATPEAEKLNIQSSATLETVVIEPMADSATSKIRQALGKPTTLDFVETPLIEVIQYLEDAHKIQIEVDKNALEEAGIAVDTPITRNLSAITLRSALNLILGQLELAYVIEDEVLSITTRDAAQDRLTVKIYPVDDLILQAEKRKSPPLTSALMNVITSTVAPVSWDESGGNGSIAPFRGSLVISQTEDVHEAVAQLLRQLRMPAVAVARDAMPVEEPARPKGKAPIPGGQVDRPADQPSPARVPSGGMGGGMGGGHPRGGAF